MCVGPWWGVHECAGMATAPFTMWRRCFVLFAGALSLASSDEGAGGTLVREVLPTGLCLVMFTYVQRWTQVWSIRNDRLAAASIAGAAVRTAPRCLRYPPTLDHAFSLVPEVSRCEARSSVSVHLAYVASTCEISVGQLSKPPSLDPNIPQRG